MSYLLIKLGEGTGQVEGKFQSGTTKCNHVGLGCCIFKGKPRPTQPALERVVSGPLGMLVFLFLFFRRRWP